MNWCYRQTTGLLHVVQASRALIHTKWEDVAN